MWGILIWLSHCPKTLTSPLTVNQASISFVFIVTTKLETNINLLTTRIPSASLVCDKWRNLLHKYLKQLPTIGKSFTNYFIRLNLVGIKESVWGLLMFCAKYFSLRVLFFLEAIVMWTWLYHFCWPRSIETTFKSSHSIQSWVV